MPSFCQDLKTRYEHLMNLTADFTTKYSDTKESGDLREMKRLRKALETAGDGLLERLAVFIVPDAMNPYQEALLAAALDLAETQEQQEMTIDIPKEIQRQLAVYREAKDEIGNPCLEEWVQDITENKHFIYRAIAKDRAKITERIKAGMIPVVMPGRSVQERTWRSALTYLKPIWVEDGTEKTVYEKNYIHNAHANMIKRMTQEVFFGRVPNRPYLVWVKPAQDIDPETANKALVQQQINYKSIVKNHPHLYDPTDLIPTEYAALQAVFTSSILRQLKEPLDEMNSLVNIYPLDYFDSCTRFLSTELSSNDDVLCAYFSNDSEHVCFDRDDSEADGKHGFRPASRT